MTVCLPDGRPHARPVWGVWLDTGFWYSTGSRATRVVGDNPHATVHLDRGDEVVIVARAGQSLSMCWRPGNASSSPTNAKYRWNLQTRERGVGDDDGAVGEVVAIPPIRVYRWTTANLQTATCWELGAVTGADVHRVPSRERTFRVGHGWRVRMEERKGVAGDTAACVGDL